jgi:MoaA/NifB/PqqE/SkfB family radical SAM enzyme
LIEAGVFRVALGGGEVLLRDDHLKTIGALSTAGIEVMLTTNGWTLTPPHARALANAGLSALYVSLDGSNAETHDRTRRQPGSFERACITAKLASEVGVNTKLSVVLSKTNFTQIDEILRIANNIPNLKEVNFKRFRPAGNGLINRSEFDLNDSDLLEIERILVLAKSVYSFDISLNFGPEPGEIDSGCSCGITSIALRPNGDVGLCSYSEHILGNLTKEALIDIWQGSPVLLLKRKGLNCAALHAQPAPSMPGNPQKVQRVQLQPLLKS